MNKEVPKSKLSKRQAELLGDAAIKFLNLVVAKDGLIKTTWGSKSIEGLGRCIERLVQEVPTHEAGEFNAVDAQGETITDSNIKLATYGGTNA